MTALELANSSIKIDIVLWSCSGNTSEGHGGAQTYDINALVAGDTDFGALRTQVNPDDAHGGNETTVKSLKIGEQ